MATRDASICGRTWLAVRIERREGLLEAHDAKRRPRCVQRDKYHGEASWQRVSPCLPSLSVVLAPRPMQRLRPPLRQACTSPICRRRFPQTTTHTTNMVPISLRNGCRRHTSACFSTSDRRRHRQIRQGRQFGGRGIWVPRACSTPLLEIENAVEGYAAGGCIPCVQARSLHPAGERPVAER